MFVISKRPKKYIIFALSVSIDSCLFNVTFSPPIIWGGTRCTTCGLFQILCAWVGHLPCTEFAMTVLTYAYCNAYCLPEHTYACLHAIACFYMPCTCCTSQVAACTHSWLDALLDIASYWAIGSASKCTISIWLLSVGQARAGQSQSAPCSTTRLECMSLSVHSSLAVHIANVLHFAIRTTVACTCIYCVA